MREVFIKYNPYKVETEILVDGNSVKKKKNSPLNFGDRRLQEWIESLPNILSTEYAAKEFHIVFHGTVLDFEDLQAVAETAKKNDGITMVCEHQPAKEVKDKETAIEAVFEEIKNNPYYAELREPDLIRAFEIARTSEFPVNVVATVSSGKSTLINALLRQKLMPVKQEPCTAVITELHDLDDEIFHAKVFNSDGMLIRSVDLTLPVMKELNADPEVSKIIAEGNIPFVTSDDVSLVLVDTPGPNNARDPEHRAATYRMLSESSKTVVLYILNATQLAINDDSSLLSYVADSMKVGGKQSKDRIIFVLNKLDEFNRSEDSVESAIERARQYLADKGIENPNIYPASALTALNIRTALRDIDLTKLDLNELDNEIVIETCHKVKKLNRNPDLHLEKYAPLPPSVRDSITSELSVARAAGDVKKEALIHSGIIPIEAAIRMYVQKYAKTAKIKGIVDTFAAKLESQRSFERTQQEIAENQDKHSQILANIAQIQKKVSDGKAAKSFQNTIDALDYTHSINDIANRIIKDAQSRVREQIEGIAGKKLSRQDAESICSVFIKTAESLQARVQVQLEETITDFIKRSGAALTESYIRRLASFAEDHADMDLRISPLELLGDEISSVRHTTEVINSAAGKETVITVHEWVVNTNKKWWKPWTWFQEKGHWHDEYEEQEFVDGKRLADVFFAPVVESLYQNKKSAVEYAAGQVKDIKKQFMVKFAEMDKLLEDKLHELEACASDQTQVEAIIAKTEKHLAWLTDIQKRIQEILEI